MKRIYLDNNATTPVDPKVVDAMLPYFNKKFGNPSSGHRFGEETRSAVEQAREQVAALIDCHASRIIFNSGGSEGNNTAIFSAVNAFPEKKHVISSQVEHASVLQPLKFLKKKGYEIELLPVDEQGGLDCKMLASAIRPDTALVTLMGANNETGVLWPVGEIGSICKDKGVLFHCDGIQMVGKEPLNVSQMEVDYLTVAGHKVHGPKGVGALYVQRTAPVTPLVMGAGQENGHRAGTENVAGIVGLGKACEIAAIELADYQSRVAPLRDYLEDTILENIPDVIINGKTLPRLSNTTNVGFKHCSSAGIIQELDERGIAVSAHSACQSGDLDPSHVLAAMNVPETYRHGALRISLSRTTTKDEVEALLEILPHIIAKSRQGFAA